MNEQKENQKQAVSAALAAFCYAFSLKMLYKMRGFWFSCDFLDNPYRKIKPTLFSKIDLCLFAFFENFLSKFHVPDIGHDFFLRYPWVVPALNGQNAVYNHGALNP